MPQEFSSKDWLERDPIPSFLKEYNLSIRVVRITTSPDKYLPVNLKPVEMEVLSQKRAKVAIEVKEDSKMSSLMARVEFRGNAITFTRNEGDCDTSQVAWRLSKYHRLRYGTPGLRIISAPGLKDSCDCTLENPAEFLDFLHLIKTNKRLEVSIQREKSVPSGVRQVEKFKLGSSQAQQFTREALGEQETNETIVQLSDRVYSFLIKELGSWSDPIAARFYEWPRLQLEERRLVMKVPPHISNPVNEASGLFESNAKLRKIVHNYVDESTRSYITQLDLVKFGDFGAVEFRLLGEPSGYDRIYISWIWERETNLSNYLHDYEPPDTKWRLETWVYSRKTGASILVGEDEQSKSIINHVLRLLMGNEQARELQANNTRIRELGPKIFSLIDEELKKG